MAKILVVADDAGVRSTLRAILRKKGHDVIEAGNGLEGLEKIERQHPEAIITDIVMPEMEGLEFVQRVLKRQPHLPIMVFTEESHELYLNMALKLGAVHGIFKPIDEAELLSGLKKLLRG